MFYIIGVFIIQLLRTNPHPEEVLWLLTLVNYLVEEQTTLICNTSLTGTDHSRARRYPVTWRLRLPVCCKCRQTCSSWCPRPVWPHPGRQLGPPTCKRCPDCLCSQTVPAQNTALPRILRKKSLTDDVRSNKKSLNLENEAKLWVEVAGICSNLDGSKVEIQCLNRDARCRHEGFKEVLLLPGAKGASIGAYVVEGGLSRVSDLLPFPFVDNELPLEMGQELEVLLLLGHSHHLHSRARRFANVS